MSEATACPDARLLARLVLGKLSRLDAGPLEEHLAHCPRCAERAGGLPDDDPLVRALRAGSPLLQGPHAPAVHRLIERLCRPGPGSRGRTPTRPNRPRSPTAPNIPGAPGEPRRCDP